MENPPNRFERIVHERAPDWDEADDPAPKTQFFRDATASIITYNDSPDVGFDASINPYRGCEHGCMCYLIIPTVHSLSPYRKKVNELGTSPKARPAGVEPVEKCPFA